jgi:hypothetical protein
MARKSSKKAEPATAASAVLESGTAEALIRDYLKAIEFSPTPEVSFERAGLLELETYINAVRSGLTLPLADYLARIQADVAPSIGDTLDRLARVHGCDTAAQFSALAALVDSGICNGAAEVTALTKEIEEGLEILFSPQPEPEPVQTPTPAVEDDRPIRPTRRSAAKDLAGSRVRYTEADGAQPVPGTVVEGTSGSTTLKIRNDQGVIFEVLPSQVRFVEVVTYEIPTDADKFAIASDAYATGVAPAGSKLRHPIPDYFGHEVIHEGIPLFLAASAVLGGSGIYVDAYVELVESGDSVSWHRNHDASIVNPFVGPYDFAIPGANTDVRFVLKSGA